MITVRRALLGAIAALLAVSASNAQAAPASMAATRSKLSSELPAGVSLARASIDQTAGAVKAAVGKDQTDATEILRVAIMSKEPKQGEGKLACRDVAKLTRAAIASDSAAASQLVDTASSLHPECADELNSLLGGANTGNDSAGAGLFAPADDYGFGVGFGPGFPGAPGFVGSAPSGGFALPPANNPTTPTTNG